MTNRTTADLREAIEGALTTGVRYEIKDTDAVCRECRGRSGHLEGCTHSDNPWPTITRLREKTLDEKLDEITALLPQPPSLGGIVQEIDGLFAEWKAAAEDDNERTAIGAQLYATFVGAYPTLRANLKQEEWQDISTAPMDWSNLLLYCPDSGRNDDVCEGYFAPKEYEGDGTWRASDGEAISPTRWMPLPTPPQSKKDR